MSIKVIGGMVAVLALAGILYFHARPKHVAPAPTPVVNVTPIALPPPPRRIEVPTPVVRHVMPKRRVPTTRPTARKRVPAAAAIWRDNSATCRVARANVIGKSAAQLERERELYHITDEMIAQYRHCFVKLAN